MMTAVIDLMTVLVLYLWPWTVLCNSVSFLTDWCCCWWLMIIMLICY